MAYQARILSDSLAPSGARLTTWVLTYQRMIHSELKTHREFSTNSGSSRALPVAKMIKQVLDDPAMPVHWGANRAGMQASEELGEPYLDHCKSVWLHARDKAVDAVEHLNKIGLHKQVANRLLEPFMWMTTIVSSTDYANFFAQRDHPDAQPEFAHLAKMMRKAYDESRPMKLRAGEWHLPFSMGEEEGLPIDVMLKVCTGRCARVSYLTHDGKHDLKADIDLHDRLLTSKPMHASPFEHCAMASDEMVQSGNFRGFVQYRKTIAGEYKSSYPQMGIGLDGGEVIQTALAYVGAYERFLLIRDALYKANVALACGLHDQGRAFVEVAIEQHGNKAAA